MWTIRPPTVGVLLFLSYMKLELSNGQWAEVKDSFTWGERRRMQEASPYSKNKEGEPVQASAVNDWSAELVSRFVTAWSFETPVSKEALENNLTAEEGEHILDLALQAIGFRSKPSDDPKAR
jgi:hypothetical protein